MYMPKHVYWRLEGNYFFQQVFIAIIFLSYNLVKDAKWRCMCQQYIGVLRYFLPMPAYVGAPMSVESPVVVKWRNRRAPDPDTFNGCSAIVEVSDAFRNEGCQLDCRYLLQAKIVVAANKNLIPERLQAKPKEEVEQLGAQTPHGNIAGVQQHIAGWQSKGMVAAVGIGDGNKLHGLVSVQGKYQMVLGNGSSGE